MSQSSLNLQAKAAGPVECLGQRFPSEEARREHYLKLLAQKLKDPEFRKIEGFPIGKDEDILALSDPPYYTICPNPWLGEFIKCYGTHYDPKQPYHREPFAADVSEGKTHPIYNAHSYHTKVPHRAIMRYLLYYTQPGDVVFDGFCGTGMTGVAAQLCGDRAEVQELGYRVQDDGTILNEEGKPFSKLGARRAILNDLSPAATFIAYNYNRPVSTADFEKQANQALHELEQQCGWMYATLHQAEKDQVREAIAILGSQGQPLLRKESRLPWGQIRYVVWSEIISCPNCGLEDTYWRLAVDEESRYRKAKEEAIVCPKCGAENRLRAWERVFVTDLDKLLKTTTRSVKALPVLIKYKYGKNTYEKKPDDFDLALVRKISDIDRATTGVPLLRMPPGDESRRNDDIGLTHVHHFYTPRALEMLSIMDEMLENMPLGVRLTLRFWVQSVGLGFTRLNRYLEASFSQVNRYLKGTLYVAPFTTEVSPWYALAGKIRRMTSTLLGEHLPPNVITSTGSTTKSPIADNSVDYVFTDPPFGGNIMYSELNFLWEAWLKVLTNNGLEAIQNTTQAKTLTDYQHLMARCFAEYCRVLKPGRWITVEFHNSKNSVWHSIQRSMQQAGFVVADVRTLDKQQMTMQQMTSTGAVKQDLVISAYKPNDGLVRRFQLEAGTQEGVWDFVRTHL
jgi:predicted RNA methylase